MRLSLPLVAFVALAGPVLAQYGSPVPPQAPSAGAGGGGGGEGGDATHAPMGPTATAGKPSATIMTGYIPPFQRTSVARQSTLVVGGPAGSENTTATMPKVTTKSAGEGDNIPLESPTVPAPTTTPGPLDSTPSPSPNDHGKATSTAPGGSGSLANTHESDTEHGGNKCKRPGTTRGPRRADIQA